MAQSTIKLKVVQFDGKPLKFKLWQRKTIANLLPYNYQRFIEAYDGAPKKGSSGENANIGGGSSSSSASSDCQVVVAPGVPNMRVVNVHDTGKELKDYLIGARAVYAMILQSLPDSVADLVLPGMADAVVQSQPEDEKEESSSEKLGCPHPYDLWIALEAEFEKSTPMHVRALREELNRAKMSGSFATFRAKINDLSARLAEHGHPVSDQDKLITLLSGLPPSAESIVTQIDYDKSQQTYASACEKLALHFDRKEKMREHDEAVMESESVAAFTVKMPKANRDGNSRHFFRGRHKNAGTRKYNSMDSRNHGDKFCSQCKKHTHTNDECWVLHPDKKPAKLKRKWESYGRVQSEHRDGNKKKHVSANAECEYCGLANHVTQDCRHKKRHDAKLQSANVHDGQQPSVGDSATVATIQTSSNSESDFVDVFSTVAMLQFQSSMDVSDNGSELYTLLHCQDQFIIDDGAAFHVVNNDSWLHDKTVLTNPIKARGYTVDSAVTDVKECGSIKINTVVSMTGSVSGSASSLNLSSVMFIPQSRYNIISPIALYKQGYMYQSVVGNPACDWRCTYNARVVLEAKIHQSKLFANLGVPPCVPASICAVENGQQSAESTIAPDAENGSPTTKPLSIMLWHKRFAHLRPESIKKLAKGGSVVGMKTTNGPSSHSCDICNQCKAHHQPFGNATHRVKNALERVHTDVCGPMKTSTIKGCQYYLVLVDDATRHVTAYCMTNKSDTITHIKQYVEFWEHNKAKKVRYIRSDNGGEYTSTELKVFCAKHGITHELTVPYTPQQNGVAERMIQTVNNRARALMLQANFPAARWDEAVREATAIINISPCTANTNNKTPNELWYERPTDVCMWRVFGCEVWVKIRQTDKFAARAVRGVNLGMDPERKAYRVLLLDNTPNHIISARDVVFNEEIFPFKRNSSSEKHARQEVHLSPNNQSIIVPLANAADPQKFAPMDLKIHSDPVPEPSNEASYGQNSLMNGHHNTDAEPILPEPEELDSESELDAKHDDDAAAGGDIKSMETAPAHLRQGAIRPNNRMSQRENRGVPSSQYAQYGMYNISASGLNDDPTTIEEAWSRSDGHEWKQATDKEYNSLLKNHTWSLVPRPQNENIITAKWVLHIKRTKTGAISTRKGRLTARGFQQRYGIDYDETFAPVGQYATLRTMIAVAMIRGMTLYQFDVESAFLNGTLQHTIYMEQPKGYNDGSGRVCKLNKAIYGLKQAAKEWNCAIHETLVSMGLEQSPKDPCLYFAKNGKAYMFLYVDDMVLAVLNPKDKDTFYKAVSVKYSVKDLGELSWLFNMNFERTSTSMFISQKLYTQKVIDKFGMKDAKQMQTPMMPMNSKFAVENGTQAKQQSVPYQSLVGALLWLANTTRPDIAFAVNKLCRKMSNYTFTDWKRAKRVVRYLLGTVQHGIKCSLSKQNTALKLVGYVDADWASDTEQSRKSVTGYIFFLSGMPIAWCSKVQHTIALSSVEAEFMALAAAVQEAIYLVQLLTTMHIQVSVPVLWCDNQGAIKIATQRQANTRCKHVDIKYLFVRDHLVNGNIQLQWIQSEDNIADILTKPLIGAHYQRLAAMIRGDNQ